LCKTQLGANLAGAQQAQRFASVVLRKLDAAAHLFIIDLPGFNVIHQREDGCQSCGMLRDFVCQSAHGLQFSVWSYLPLGVIRESNP
jgi:hypothetical protein